jgi:hypothetical protein
MTFWILPASCKVVARSTVSSLTEDEKADPVVQTRMAELDLSIKEKIGDSLKDEADEDGEGEVVQVMGISLEVPDDIFLPDDDADYEPTEPEASMPEADDYYMPESYDEYLTAEVLLPNMGTVTKAKIIGWKRDQDGNPIGKRNANPILDMREYEVEFQDGATDTFTANIIAENLYSQVDSEGNSFSILDEIVDHKSDRTALSKDDRYEVAKDGRPHPK